MKTENKYLVNIYRYGLLSSMVVCLLALSAQAQNQSRIWYFGQYAGLDFSSGTPVALTDGALEILNGCSTIADSNGKLVFYTDGYNVWNRNHQLMPGNSTKLHGGGNYSTHSGYIVPAPGNSRLYYIFTTNGSLYGLQYSIVDMGLEGGLGDLTRINVPVFDSATVKVTAIRHKNKHDIWIVTHDRRYDTFYTYLLSDAGLSTTPVLTHIGSMYSINNTENENEGGQIKVSADGSKIAVGIGKPIDKFEVFDFDNATGILSDVISFPSIHISHGANGVEFSPDGTKLYGVRFAPNVMYQYNLAAGSAAAIIASEVVISPATSGSIIGGLQLAPDGKIYASQSYRPYIGVINEPNKTGVACDFAPKAITLGGKESNNSLPSFMVPYFRKPAIAFNPVCEGKTTFFSLSDSLALFTPDSRYDSLAWDFGDPASGNNTAYTLTPSHRYSAAGTYTLRLRVYFNGTSDVLSTQVVVPPVPTVELGSPREACLGQDYVLDAGAQAGCSYLWSTGETTQTISVNSTADYWVQIANVACQARDTVHVEFTTFTLSASGAGTICQGNSVALHAEGTSAYRWEPTEGLSDPQSADPIATPTKTITYTVTGTAQNGCSQQKSVTVTVISNGIVGCSIGDTLAKVGADGFRIPIRLHTSETLPLLLGSVKVKLRLDASFYDVKKVSTGVMKQYFEGDDLIIELELQNREVKNANEILTELEGDILLGRSLSSEMVVEQVFINDCEQSTGMSNSGMLNLDATSVCVIEGRRVKFRESSTLVIAPNPATEVKIRVIAAEEGVHRLAIYDVGGRVQWSQEFRMSEGVTREYNFEPALSAGLYEVVLYSSTGVQTHPLSVVR